MRERRGFGRGGGGFGGGGFDRDFDKPKPVKIGEEYDVEITDVGAKGDGITKVENFIVFVPGGKKGENCRIKIKEVASRFAIGEKVGEGKAKEAAGDEETGEASEDEESQEEEQEAEAEEESGEESEGDYKESGE